MNESINQCQSQQYSASHPKPAFLFLGITSSAFHVTKIDNALFYAP